MPKDNLFRIQVRLSRTEYQDLVADLERHGPQDRSARAKLLMRTGLSAINGQVSVMESAPPVAGLSVVTHQQQQRLPSNAAGRLPGVELFDSLGLDPSDFKFGTA